MAARKLLVEFGAVGGGDEVARIGFRVSRDRLTLEDAERLLCGKRIMGRIVCRGDDEDGDQKGLDGDAPRIEGTFDCKNIRVTPKWISGSLSFQIDEHVENTLLRLAKRSGALTINKALVPDDVTKVPKKDPAAPAQKQLAVATPERPKIGDKVAEHFSAAVLRKCDDNGLKTIRQLVVLRDNGQLEEFFTAAQAGMIVAALDGVSNEPSSKKA